MMLNWWLDFSITRRICAGDEEFDEHRSLLIRWFADIELSSSSSASFFLEELGGILPIFSKKEVLSSEGRFFTVVIGTRLRTPPRRNKMLTSMPLPSRATAAAKYSSAFFEKDVWKRQPIEGQHLTTET